jgi:hypothetical protein
MKKADHKAKLPMRLPSEGRKLLRKTELIPGEDPAAYNALANTIIAELKPTDIIECMFVRDIVRYQWELTQRLRLMEADWFRVEERREREFQKVAAECVRKFLAALEESGHQTSSGAQHRYSGHTDDRRKTSPKMELTNEERASPSDKSELAKAFQMHGSELEKMSARFYGRVETQRCVS